MRRRLALLALPLFAAPALGQLKITWYTIDCGGGTISGGSLEVSSTIGQADASGPMNAGSLQLTSGFWVEQPRCGDIDFNNDGVYPDTTDIFDYLAVMSGASCPTCDSLDFNLDGVYPDNSDVFLLLYVLSGGTC